MHRKIESMNYLHGRNMFIFVLLAGNTLWALKTIARDLKVAPSKQQPGGSCSDLCLRSTQLQSDLKTKCMLCSETIDNKLYSTQYKRHLHQYRQVYLVRTTKFDRSLLTCAKDHKVTNASNSQGKNKENVRTLHWF